MKKKELLCDSPHACNQHEKTTHWTFLLTRHMIKTTYAPDTLNAHMSKFHSDRIRSDCEQNYQIQQRKNRSATIDVTCESGVVVSLRFLGCSCDREKKPLDIEFNIFSHSFCHSFIILLSIPITYILPFPTHLNEMGKVDFFLLKSSNIRPFNRTELGVHVHNYWNTLLGSCNS